MNLEKIKTDLSKISSKLNKETFIYDFLLAYGLPKSSVNRLKKGDYNQSKIDGEIIWAKKIYFKPVSKDEDVHDIIDEISKTSDIEKQKIRFVIVTDFKTFLSKDIKIGDTLDIELSKLVESLNFFLPLIGREKIILDKENPADIKAANQMGKLYDQIIKDNEDYDLEKYRDNLNLFFTRLLFLYYADDSEIFKKNQFFDTITKFTEKDGSDLNDFFNNLFVVLNKEDRSNVEVHLKVFPYVNGNLFHGKITLPKFTKNTRQMIIDGASLDWAMINPDILGSMLQSIVSAKEREDDEMHYTSVPNILKVIKPLFLDSLEKKIIEAEEDEKKLKKILRHIYNTKYFDPACGSGNFLIITYIQLCLLEIKIFKNLIKINPNDWKLSMPGISINQFYGIEKSNYASETAKLSLWIVEHQMNLHFKEIFGRINPSLPLKENENILNANSAEIQWESFCKKDRLTEHIYIISNPPYKGFARQNIHQKNDMSKVFKEIKDYKRLDYVTLWFFKASKFITFNKDSSCSLVSTNSICQGEQIKLFWPHILNQVEINFAYKSFPWGNNAKNNAVVTCVIIGLSKSNSKIKLIYDGSAIEQCKYINPYLSSNEILEISKQDKPLNKDFPRMIGGNQPLDDGHLKLSQKEYDDFIRKYPQSKVFFRKLVGGSEFLNGLKRWVIWLNDKNLSDAVKIPEIKERIENVKKFRSKEDAGQETKRLVTRPHQFRFINEAKKNFILVPYTSSINRSYLPIAFFDSKYIPLNSGIIIFDPPVFIFSILSSKIFFDWVKNTSGKMKNDIRFSSSLCYNTFPFPDLSNEDKQKLTEMSLKIIDEREKFSEKSINKLYNKNMPNSLKQIHLQNDELIDSYFFGKKITTYENKMKILYQSYVKLKNENRLL